MFLCLDGVAHADNFDTSSLGLAPGSQFRLVFVTSGTTDATSADIGFYNDFVNTAGSAITVDGVNVDWKAIASTSSVDAVDNLGGIAQEIPILDLNAVMIADSLADMFDGTIDNPIRVTEYMTTLWNAAVWTGTGIDGTANNPLGGPDKPWMGRTYYTNISWIFNCIDPSYYQEHMYSMSAVLTVPGSPTTSTASVPEPFSLPLLAIGLGMAGSIARKHQRSSFARN